MDKNKFYKGMAILGGNALLKLSKDDMEIFLEPVAGDIDSLNLEGLRDILKDLDIDFGPYLSPQRDGNRLVLARGTAPIPGIDGRIEIAVGLPRPPPSDEDDDSVDRLGNQSDDSLFKDPKALRTVLCVRKGTVVAKKIPPTPGTPGKNVFNEEIPAVPGEWPVFRPGEGVEVIDRDSLVANRDGKLHLEDGGLISVLDTWTIEGPLDMSIGHTDFWGRELRIAGPVLGGLRVKVEGNLFVEGNIEDEAMVEVDGNLTVNGLIRSSNTRIIVSGDMVCNAVEYAKVRVDGDLEVDDYLLDADCDVRGHVWLVNGKGLVAGGSLSSGGSIAARVLGTQAHVLTRVRAGYDSSLRKRYEAMINEIEKLSRKLSEIEAGLERIKNVERSGPGNQEIAIIKAKLKKGREDILSVLSKKRAALANMDAHFGKMRNSTIQVHSMAYPSVSVQIDTAALVLTSLQKKCVFRFRKGEIVTLIP